MGELAALGAAAAWAVASLMFARIGRAVGPVVLNLTKTAVGLVLMAATLLVLDHRVWPVDLSSEAMGWLAVSGVIGLTIGDSAYFSALVRLGPRRALLLWALIPPVTAILAIPALGEDLTGQMVAGIAVTLAGVTWVLRERTADMNGGSPRDAVLPGAAFGAVAVACQAGGSVTAKLGGLGLSALELSVVRLTFGALGLLVHALFTRPEALRSVADPRTLGRITGATLLGTYVGIWLAMLSLQLTFAGVATTLQSTSPIFALPLAYFVLRERLSVRAVAGAVVAVAGVAVLVLKPGA